jgi:SAM-dependent methyltransferase
MFRRLAHLLRNHRSRERDDWHREDVGGLWDELGKLQFDFLVAKGLEPRHFFLDVGCGSLRGGVHFIRYLEPSHYYGIEKQPELLAAAREIEIPRYGLTNRGARLLQVDDFDLGCIPADVCFEFALAQSLFTQLLPEQIELCLERVMPRLASEGVFFSTFWESDEADHGVTHPWRSRERSRTRYPLSLFRSLAERLDLRLEYLGDWGHPRGQKMLTFRRP